MCGDKYFISYNGECELCDINYCNECYYGSKQGIDKFYTLENDFLYINNQKQLLKKCLDC